MPKPTMARAAMRTGTDWARAMLKGPDDCKRGISNLTIKRV